MRNGRRRYCAEIRNGYRYVSRQPSRLSERQHSKAADVASKVLVIWILDPLLVLALMGLSIVVFMAILVAAFAIGKSDSKPDVYQAPETGEKSEEKLSA